MAFDKLIPVNMVVADRTYRIKIDPADEETVRRTIRVINEKIVEYKTSFSGKDMQDYVSMVLLWFATEQQKTDSTIFSADDERAMQHLEDVIDKALQ